ncbi:MAG: amidohydrolase family protein [Anoxybacillus ayderensis]|nr:amidohydrolase family protein [Anoxybacillus ayderensis]
MWRIAFISTLLFLGVSAGALYYQWDEYHTEATKQSVLQHDVEAKFTGKTIEVVHHIRGAVTNTYEVTVPKEVKNVSCVKQKQCVKQKNGKTIVHVPNTHTISLTYRVTVAQKEPLFIKEWLIRFHTAQPQQMNISLDEALRMARWYPAKAVGLDHQIVLLEAGYRSGLIVFDERFQLLYRSV